MSGAKQRGIPQTKDLGIYRRSGASLLSASARDRSRGEADKASRRARRAFSEWPDSISRIASSSRACAKSPSSGRLFESHTRASPAWPSFTSRRPRAPEYAKLFTPVSSAVCRRCRAAASIRPAACSANASLARRPGFRGSISTACASASTASSNFPPRPSADPRLAQASARRG